jgi:putative PIN family toxin of toxin-antitoxin system
VKIVLDTTILVRANEHSHGLARELLMRIVGSDHRLLLSNEMLYELARVLRYPRLQAFYDLPEELVFEYTNFLRGSSEIIPLNPFVTAPIRDVNDVVVMQTAIIGEADILCTKRARVCLVSACRRLHTPLLHSRGSETRYGYRVSEKIP